jgi:hypothetical protein
MGDHVALLPAAQHQALRSPQAPQGDGQSDTAQQRRASNGRRGDGDDPLGVRDRREHRHKLAASQGGTPLRPVRLPGARPGPAYWPKIAR